jgi:hypothetical protein
VKEKVSAGGAHGWRAQITAVTHRNKELEVRPQD